MYKVSQFYRVYDLFFYTRRQVFVIKSAKYKASMRNFNEKPPAEVSMGPTTVLRKSPNRVEKSAK